MLYIYTYAIPKPDKCFDLSTTPLDELCDAVIAIVNHHKEGHLWFGYIDGWMLHPREEVILRKAIRKFNCSVVSFFPLSLSHAWKNETFCVYTDGEVYDGIPQTHNDGRLVCDGRAHGHGQASSQPTSGERNHQDRETGSSKKRRVKEGQNKT